MKMHPLGWGVNHEILHNHFNWPAYIAPASLVSDPKRDVSLLKTHSFAPIITNAYVPSTNKWRPYLHDMYFDTGTSSAYIHIGSDIQPLMSPAEESLRLALDYIAELNEQNGCFDIAETWESTIPSSFTIEALKNMSCNHVAPLFLSDAIAVSIKLELQWVLLLDSVQTRIISLKIRGLSG